MINCPNCGKKIADDSAHCGYCGEEIESSAGNQKQTMFGMAALGGEELDKAVKEAKDAKKDSGDSSGGGSGFSLPKPGQKKKPEDESPASGATPPGPESDEDAAAYAKTEMMDISGQDDLDDEPAGEPELGATQAMMPDGSQPGQTEDTGRAAAEGGQEQQEGGSFGAGSTGGGFGSESAAGAPSGPGEPAGPEATSGAASTDDEAGPGEPTGPASFGGQSQGPGEPSGPSSFGSESDQSQQQGGWGQQQQQPQAQEQSQQQQGGWGQNQSATAQPQSSGPSSFGEPAGPGGQQGGAMQPSGNQNMQGQAGQGGMPAPVDNSGGSSKMILIIVGALAVLSFLACAGGLAWVFLF